MSKNLIPKIAEMLGVELGEEFKAVSKDGSERVCILTHKGLLNKDTNYVYYNKELFVDIVCGDAEVVKLPWKPKDEEIVYSFYNADMRGVRVDNFVWSDNIVLHQALLKAGWVYRTREEAEAALPAVAKELGVTYEL